MRNIPFRSVQMVLNQKKWQEQVLPQVIASSRASLKTAAGAGEDYQRIVIGPHTLFGEYPPKNPEAEIKPVNESGEIVLSRVVIPEYIVVHDGPVGDTTAQNYYVRYKDYIKNVASSEIYATWPDDTIRANVLAIMSFTLNRVYTEWYRKKAMIYHHILYRIRPQMDPWPEYF